MLALVIVEALVIALLVILVAGLLRSHAEILRRLDALGAGEDMEIPVPVRRSRTADDEVAMASVSGTTPSGGTASIPLSDSRGHVLLAFLSSGCASCRTFWEAFSGGVDMPAADLRPVIVTKGPAGESPAEIAALAPRDVVTVMSDEAWDAFRIPGTPYFQLVDAARGIVVGEGSAGSWPRVVELIRRALADGAHEGKRIRLSTAARLRDSDDELRQAGIHPGDPSLFRQPGDGV